MLKDATYLANLLINREISPTELINEKIAQINRSNPLTNALVDFDEEIYIKRYLSAQNTDISSTLFGGIPIPLKILGQSKKGFADTSASSLFKGNLVISNNNFVNQLENIGLVPVGKTNAPEFGFKNVTDSKLYGNAHNPWNLEFSPGGSSGGAAAAVASGMFPLAAASDGGGSIRIPASFSGLIGLKPTRGTMPVGPESWRGWQGASIDFALGISIRDIKKLFFGMRTDSVISPFQPPKAEWLNHTPKDKLKIAFTYQTPINTEISIDAKNALNKSLKLLGSLGYELTEINNPIDGLLLMDSYYKMNAGETAKMFSEIQTNTKKIVTKNNMELMTWGLYQYGLNISAAEYSLAFDQWDKATQIMEENIFSNFDLFLTPTTAYPAPNLNTDLQSDNIRKTLNNSEFISKSEQQKVVFDMFFDSLKLSPFTQLANLTGEPAISLPIWVGENNLPLGVQFMAAKGREDLLFQISEQLENNNAFELPVFYKNTREI